MSSEKRRRVPWGVLAASGVIVATFAAACQDSMGFRENVSPPDSLSATAVSVRAVRVEWSLSSNPDVAGYRVERRKDLAGPFDVLVPLVPHAPPGPMQYFDLQVEPETRYGYRVRSITRLGGLSEATVVRGAKTPPKPGILVRISSSTPTSGAVDPDGYLLEARNSHNTFTSAVGPSGDVRFPALPLGHYDVELRGLVSYCSVPGGTVRSLEVSDDGPNTIDTLGFAVVCRDPQRGRIVVRVAATGDSLDANGYSVGTVGLLDDRTLPEADRVVQGTVRIPGPAGGGGEFDNLRPGSYQVQLDDVAGNCQLAGAALRDVTVTPLSIDTVKYVLTCEKAPQPVDNRPFKLVNQFSPQAGPGGAKVTLRVSVDLRDDPAAALSAVQASLFFDKDVLRFDSAGAEGSFQVPPPNSSAPGQVSWQAFTTQQPYPKGLLPVARLMFTVTGASGATVFTRNREVLLGNENGDPYPETLFRVVEDTFAVGSGGGGATNQPPTVSIAGGAHTGTVGNPIAFTANASDPDGTIVSYAWSWGNGSTTVTSPTTSRTYSIPGTYTAQVIVTDNLGATASASVGVTVTGGATNQPPVAQANVPASGTVSSPISVNASGSSDPDGSIVGWSWSWGDQTAAGTTATATHTYASPGTYTVTLTVTDNGGLSDTDARTVVISPGGPVTTPFTWTYSFGAADGDSIPMVISLDLTTDIPETPAGEALASFVLDSLTWNPAVLQHKRTRFTLGNYGSASAGVGYLRIPSGTVVAQNSTGILTLATIWFTMVGGPASSTNTHTVLTALTGTAPTNSYNYRPRTSVIEATFVRP